MRLAVLAGKQAGMVGMLAAAAAGHHIAEVVAYDEIVYDVAYHLGYLTRRKLSEAYLGHVDLILCVHGREIVPDEILGKAKYGGVNVHPMLSKYPGADPVGRWLQSNGRLLHESERIASVGAHRMTDKIDGGPVLCEEFVTIHDAADPYIGPGPIYNLLYPLYARVVLQALALAPFTKTVYATVPQ